ncbi:MAGUK p55 subfamily member 7 isoform X3 [Latimeria chalumnae]|uniref:MAGUK p55 subfamily member 7 isoform X3 n=1 Tax=Latimeria chalumnae TaxID=7897 RepID=UPI00313EBEFF
MPALSTGSGNDTGLYELLAALPTQLQPHVNNQKDLTFLRDMFGEKSLHSLVKLAEELQSKPMSNEIRELLKLLTKPHLKALLSVHDTVAQKSYDPVLPPVPDDFEDDEDSVKIIRLVKNKEPLGATIKKDEQTGAIIVARIMHGGAADRSGLIHVGDELREVNGITVEGKKPEEIIQILAHSQGAITFKIIPSIKEEMPNKEGKMFVKALFDYDPNEDKAIPCKEAGLAFRMGDILQIMSQDDATWWQAKHEGDANPRAGLIPSKQFQERRFALKRPVALVQPQKNSNRRSSSFRRSFRLSRKDRKTNKSMYECKKSEQYDMADLPTYEEVTTYQRKTNEKYRLIILVGPVGVGLNELKRKLLISNSQHYGVTVPHTTRPKRSQESDGVEYIFISKHLFETDIQNNKFIEYGEYKGNYYGTSIDSIRSVLAKNKVCLLDVQPHVSVSQKIAKQLSEKIGLTELKHENLKKKKKKNKFQCKAQYKPNLIVSSHETSYFLSLFTTSTTGKVGYISVLLHYLRWKQYALKKKNEQFFLSGQQWSNYKRLARPIPIGQVSRVHLVPYKLVFDALWCNLGGGLVHFGLPGELYLPSKVDGVPLTRGT